MATHRPLLLLASVALLTGALGACSQGASSPTEPSLGFDSKATAGSSLESVAGNDIATKGGGDDDGSADDNGGRRGGNDDDGTTGNDNRRGRGRGNDDGTAGDDNRQRRNRGRGGRGRGGNDQPGPQPTPTPGQPQPTPTPQAPRAGAEFEARVQSVNGQAITLVTGQRIVVNGQTTWAARGDLHSLADISGSLAAGLNPRVEGRGNRQADGSIVAVTIKGEHDGD